MATLAEFWSQCFRAKLRRSSGRESSWYEVVTSEDSGEERGHKLSHALRWCAIMLFGGDCFNSILNIGQNFKGGHEGQWWLEYLSLDNAWV